MTLWKYIKHHMLSHSQQLLIENNIRITYAEVIEYVEEFSKTLSGQTCCAILCSSEMMSAITLLSCLCANVTAVPLSTRYGILHCEKILNTIGPTAIITDEGTELRINKLPNSSYVPPDKHPSLIMCTSGTTGNPKGVMLSEKNILTNLKDINAYLMINSADQILIARPLYHCAVLTGELLISLINGLKIYFYSSDFNPNILRDMIRDFQITVYCGTPTQINMLTRFNKNNAYSSIRTMCISGECLSSQISQSIINNFPNANVYYVYGLTEASPRISYLPPHLFHINSECVGYPLNSISIKIINADGNIAKTQEEGLLWIKGDNIMIGYYNAPEETKKILVDGWLCTGDIATIDNNGLLKIKGRYDNLIIRGGMNIYPQEIENALRKNPKVKDVLVYGTKDKYNTMQICMKISGDFKNIDEVKEVCLAMLPKFQIPTYIELIDELPRNASGKIIRTP